MMKISTCLSSSFASSAKAERELGFRLLPIYTALRAAIEWFVEHGYAPPFASQAQ